ncbi:hypothetical protein [Thiomicrorhabdus cannonii]|uniref:hypothetical protein n=1 Tax=Thiomicrorhabdus cannonii TaxID=2748011 RepID=UPI0015C07312|nr:hypothetical protein [Thiomicrorhabdus cannonii]
MLSELVLAFNLLCSVVLVVLFIVMMKRVNQNNIDLNARLDGYFSGVKSDFDKLNVSCELMRDSTDKGVNSLVNLISRLRVENLIGLDSKLSANKEFIEEDEHYLKRYGFSKVVEIVDKIADTTTTVNYDEKGDITEARTYANDNGTLKYLASYKNGSVEVGMEFESLNLSREYEYDEAGEVKQVVEYTYDDDSNVIEKVIHKNH